MKAKYIVRWRENQMYQVHANLQDNYVNLLYEGTLSDCNAWVQLACNKDVIFSQDVD
jgi:hypothetical protein